MNCAHVRSRLADYSAGLVQGDQRVTIRDHIAGCAGCAAELAEFRTLDGLLARERVTADEALVQSVMAHVRALPPVRRPTWITMLDGVGPLAAMAVAAPVLALLLLQLLSTGALPEIEIAGAPVPLATALAPAIAGVGAAAIAWGIARTAGALD
jgi:hypothetical protein